MVNAATTLFSCMFFMIWHPLNLPVFSSCCFLSCVFSASGKFNVSPPQIYRWLPHLTESAYTIVSTWKLSPFSHLWPNITHLWKPMSKATFIEAFSNVHSPAATLDFPELLQCFQRLYGTSNCLPCVLVLYYSSPAIPGTGSHVIAGLCPPPSITPSTISLQVEEALWRIIGMDEWMGMSGWINVLT